MGKWEKPKRGPDSYGLRIGVLESHFRVEDDVADRKQKSSALMTLFLVERRAFS